MDSKARKWLKENYSNENWNFKEGQVPDDQWKFIEERMEKYAQEQVKNLTIPVVSGSLPSSKDIIQEAIDTCPEYEREQKDADCGGAYKSGFVLGATWLRDLLKNNDR